MIQSDIGYYLPRHSKSYGGVKQIHRLAEALNQVGKQATIVQESKSFHPGWFNSVSTISLNDWTHLKDINYERDVIIMPETFASYTQNQPGIKKIILIRMV